MSAVPSVSEDSAINFVPEQDHAVDDADPNIHNSYWYLPRVWFCDTLLTRFLLHIWWTTSCRLSGLLTFRLYSVYILFWRVSYNSHNKWRLFYSTVRFYLRLHSSEKRLILTSRPPVRIVQQGRPTLFFFMRSPKCAYISHPCARLQTTLPTRVHVTVKSFVYCQSRASSVSDTTLMTTPHNHVRAARDSALYHCSPQLVCLLLWAFIGAW
jgi:hypothetical protein